MIPKKLNIIIFSTIIFGVVLLLASIILDIKYEKQLLHKQLKVLDTSIKDEYKKRLKESVNHIIMFIDTTYNDKIEEQKKTNPNTTILSAENEQKVIKTIKKYFYNSIFEKTRYAWINKIINFEGGENYAIRLIHPNLKKTEGIYLDTDTTDIKGNMPYKEELEGIKEKGEIYFTYYFKELNSNKITEKLSFAKIYKKTNWVIATGIPVNSLNDIVLKEEKKLKQEYKTHMTTVLLLRFLILILFIVILLILRKKLSKTLIRNIELNKELKNRLETAETNFDKFFELPINILLIANFKAKILQVNSGWEKILGYENNELIGKKILDFIHPTDIAKTLKEMEKLSHGEMTFYFENRFRHKDGTYKTLAWSANSQPKKNLIYAVAQDITELKEKSALMFQQSKMAAIGEMTSNIAHQWRQPLSIISTASSGIILKKECNDLDDDFLIDTMNQITQSTQYLSETIEDFRNFFNPHKEKTEFTINHIFDKTLNLVEKRFQDNNIEFIKSIDDIKIYSFENELLQVIINLLNNARDQLIKVKLKRSLIKINAYEQNKKVFIEIIDNGNGIEEKIIDRIFEPYFTTKDKSIGTGIGLYMSEEIINKHLHGIIKAENISFEYDGVNYIGAKFTISFENLKD